MEKKEGRKEFSRNPSLNVNVKRVKLSRRRERERRSGQQQVFVRYCTQTNVMTQSALLLFSSPVSRFLGHLFSLFSSAIMSARS